jgi:hypothetical protein
VNFATGTRAQGLALRSRSDTARVWKQMHVGDMVYQVMYFACNVPCEFFPVSELHDFCAWILSQDKADIEDGAEIRF